MEGVFDVAGDRGSNGEGHDLLEEVDTGGEGEIVV